MTTFNFGSDGPIGSAVNQIITELSSFMPMVFQLMAVVLGVTLAYKLLKMFVH